MFGDRREEDAVSNDDNAQDTAVHLVWLLSIGHVLLLCSTVLALALANAVLPINSSFIKQLRFYHAI